MKSLTLAIIVVVAGIACSKVVLAQGIGEYGRVVGGAAGNAKGIGKPGSSVKGLPDLPVSRAGSKGMSAFTGLPSVLTVSAATAPIYSRSEDWSDKVGEVSQGEKVTPLVQSTGATSIWYMVKTQSGATGWIRAADVAIEQKNSTDGLQAPNK